ncbi:hypothetical protein B0H11DRAFT_2247444 [Mycena galericulata]|nr:hypothetical protein B0H11DRAFT_2247444 [Mycena galericulata]
MPYQDSFKTLPQQSSRQHHSEKRPNSHSPSTNSYGTGDPKGKKHGAPEPNSDNEESADPLTSVHALPHILSVPAPLSLPPHRDLVHPSCRADPKQSPKSYPELNCARGWALRTPQLPRLFSIAIRGVWRIIHNCLAYSDQRFVEFACVCVILVVDSYHGASVENPEALVGTDLIHAVN